MEHLCIGERGVSHMQPSCRATGGSFMDRLCIGEQGVSHTQPPCRATGPAGRLSAAMERPLLEESKMGKDGHPDGQRPAHVL